MSNFSAHCLIFLVIFSNTEGRVKVRATNNDVSLISQLRTRRNASADDSRRQLRQCLSISCMHHVHDELYERCLVESCLDTTNSIVHVHRRSGVVYGVIPLPISELAASSSRRYEHAVAVCPERSLASGEMLKYCTEHSCYVLSMSDPKTALDTRAANGEHVNARMIANTKTVSNAWADNDDDNNEVSLVKENDAEATSCLRQRCAYLAGGEDDDESHLLFQLCVKERCCSTARQRQSSSTTLTQEDVKPEFTRARRVNDDVSQCIQSYCSGKVFRERILCIVKNCNRSQMSNVP